MGTLLGSLTGLGTFTSKTTSLDHQETYIITSFWEWGKAQRAKQLFVYLGAVAFGYFLVNPGPGAAAASRDGKDLRIWVKDSERRPVPSQGSVKGKEAAFLHLLLQTSWGFPAGCWWRMTGGYSFWGGESEKLHVSVSKLTTNIQSIVAVVVKLLSHAWLFVAPWTSTTGFPVLHYLPELAQTHIHWVGDAIQPSYPLCLLLLLPSVFPQIKVFFHWVSSSHQVAKVLELQLQHQFFQWIFRVDFP